MWQKMLAAKSASEQAWNEASRDVFAKTSPARLWLICTGVQFAMIAVPRWRELVGFRSAAVMVGLAMIGGIGMLLYLKLLFTISDSDDFDEHPWRLAWRFSLGFFGMLCLTEISKFFSHNWHAVSLGAWLLQLAIAAVVAMTAGPLALWSVLRPKPPIITELKLN
jgi:hypothetical protein